MCARCAAVWVLSRPPGNYAASLKAQDVAEAEGYTQVLWLDGVERKYIEEVGTMNVFFKIGGEIITPELQGSILGGITRMSCIELLRSWGYTVTERRLALDEVVAAAKNGTLDEAFGTGTAAVISPIGELKVDDDKIVINHGEIGEVAQRLYTTLTDIQNGRAADPFGWVVPGGISDKRLLGLKESTRLPIHGKPRAFVFTSFAAGYQRTGFVGCGVQAAGW